MQPFKRTWLFAKSIAGDDKQTRKHWADAVKAYMDLPALKVADRPREPAKCPAASPAGKPSLGPALLGFSSR
jgi:hypothetical protein